jgi:hypothetical protein
VLKLAALPIIAAGLLGSAIPALAEYVLVLKNGRQIMVQSYREEGSMIKFQGFGGEIGISKDQLQTIRKGSAEGGRGLDVTAPERVQPSASRETAGESAPTPPSGEDTPLSPEEERASEEKDYQQKLSEITQQLKEARDRYSQSVRGTSSRDPNLQFSEDQRDATRDDVISRFREATSNPSEPAPVRLLTPSPFSSLPPTIVENQPTGRAPTSYDSPLTERQRELSELRNQSIQLEKERGRLIDEMRQKSLSTGTLFLE